jgi:hypothetical protein
MTSASPEHSTYLFADDVMRVCRLAVHKAQDDSRRRGVANVYFINGKRIFELPNGELTREDPTGDRNRSGA